MNRQNEFNFEEALNRRGTKQNGFINVALKPDGTWVRIPIMVVCGVEDGQTLLADACHHGDEYEGTEGIIKVVNSLDPAKVKGTFIGVPALNLDAFSAGQRVSPIDFSHADLNRSYPGSSDRFLTSLIAKTYMDNVVKKADYLITLHGGGNYLYLEPLALYQEPVDEVGKTSREMAEAFGVKVLWRTQPLQFGGILDEETHKIGIPTITPEIGGQCVRHNERCNNVRIVENGILNVMKYLGMLDGEIEGQNDKIHVDIDYLYSQAGGIHIPLKRPLELVREGEILARVENIFGEQVGEVKAPYDGVVIGYWSYSVIQPRSWSYMYAKVLE